MSEHTRVIQVGDATLALLNLGEVNFPLAGLMNVPSSEVTARAELASLAEQRRIPVYTFYVQTPGTVLIVDPGHYDYAAHPEFGIPGYTPPPGLDEQLARLELRPEAVEHVVITHCHWDHFNGSTAEHNHQWTPRFPNARHYVGRADWQGLAEALRDAASGVSKTLGVLQQHNLIELVDGDRDLGHGVQILAAPGESDGHQIVRVHSAGSTLYCLGDLFHHSVEVTHPELTVSWANAETGLASRHALIRRALAENALLVAAHIPGAGRLRQSEAGVVWETA